MTSHSGRARTEAGRRLLAMVDGRPGPVSREQVIAIEAEASLSLDVELLARAWWWAANEDEEAPLEEAPWEDASETDRAQALASARAIAARYSCYAAWEQDDADAMASGNFA